MKNKFIGYYWSEDDYEDEVWKNAILVVDTNVLLDIYRVSPETSKNLISILKTFAEEDRLWIPYQVAQEYHDELYHVVYSQIKNFDKAYKCLNDFKVNIDQKRNYPFLTKEQNKKVDKMADQIKQIFEKQKSDLNESIKSGSLKSKIANIFNGRVGEPLNDEEIKKIHEEGDKRYASKIPPGYKDKGKDSNKQYGDLIIWKQIISYAKENNKNIIFVSSDTKEDWYLKEDSQFKVPHPLLFQEFAEETDQHILIYSLELFLKIVKAKGVADVETATLDELFNMLLAYEEMRKNEETEYSSNIIDNFIQKNIDNISETNNKVDNTDKNVGSTDSNS